MRIGVEGDPGTEMAQHIGQCLHIHTAGEGHRGESMAQIMEANTLLNARLRQQFPVNPGHRVRAPVAAGAGDGNRMGLSGGCSCSRTRIGIPALGETGEPLHLNCCILFHDFATEQLFAQAVHGPTAAAFLSVA